jgi:hypothetical protein
MHHVWVIIFCFTVANLIQIKFDKKSSSFAKLGLKFGMISVDRIGTSHFPRGHLSVSSSIDG